MNLTALSQEDRRLWDRFVWGSFLLVTLFGWLVKLPILYVPILNPDSVIYVDLAQGLVSGRGYTLQGSALLEDLPASLYDHPIFNHPPGFTFLLVPLVYSGIPQAAIFVSWLGQTLCVLAVALVGRELLASRCREGGAKLIYGLAIVGTALDPILSFCSRRIWMDDILAGFVALAFAGVVLYRHRNRRGWLLVAGLAMAAAVGTKLIVLVFFPLLLVAVLWRRPLLREWKSVLILCVPASVVFLAWEAAFFRAMGVFFPYWFSIGEDLLRNNQYVAHQVASSPWYLVEAMLEIVPLTLLLLPLAAWEAIRRGNRTAAFLLGSIVLYVGLLIALGMKGVSKEARYLTVAMPLWYMLLFSLRPLQGHRPLLLMTVGLAILAGAMLSGVYYFAPAYDEPMSAFGLLELLRTR